MESSTSIAVSPNVQIIQDAYANFLKGNVAAIAAACTEDVVWGSYKNPEVPFSGMYYGKEGVLEFFKTLSENIDYTSFEPKEFFSDGDSVFVLGSEEGMVKTTGSKYGDEWCMHFRLKDGKIKYFFAFVDTYGQVKAYRKV